MDINYNKKIEVIKFKMKYPFMTFDLKKKKPHIYNLMKLHIILSQFQQGYKNIKCSVNRKGTNFLFKPIESESEIENYIKRLSFIQKDIQKDKGDFVKNNKNTKEIMKNE